LLGYTPTYALDCTPAEIVAALEARHDYLNADKATGPELPVGDQIKRAMRGD
jgi:hypothetical protein